MEIIQINKFSHLHNDNDFIFCKTDFLENEFSKIRKIKNDVILITGNSDYSIDDNVIKHMPSNIKKWYGQNILSNHPNLIPIPMGIENKLESFRLGHGIGYYERVQEKENILNNIKNIIPYKKIYANFNVNTNYAYRSIIKDICINSKHIVWEEPILSLSNFFDTILDFEIIVCPIGNGVDTHRLWEVLYSGRTPLTIKVGNYKIYELYKKLPIIILDSIDDLYNEKIIYEKFFETKSKNFNINLLDFNYWKNIIKEG
jgi:hypothetical protein